MIYLLLLQLACKYRYLLKQDAGLNRCNVVKMLMMKLPKRLDDIMTG
jgi:hypothetical protein